MRRLSGRRYGDVRMVGVSFDPYPMAVRTLCAIEPYRDYPEVQAHMKELKSLMAALKSETPCDSTDAEMETDG